MKVGIRFAAIAALLAFAAVACAPGASKPAYPTKPVTIIVPFAPGGGTDTTARQLAEAAKPYFPQPITVVNRPGGGGTVGMAEVIQSDPDGYTAGLAGTSLLIQPHITDLPYKGPDDYTPIVRAVIAPVIFAVRDDAPWKTMQELLDHAKANPGKVRVTTSGYGASLGLDLETLKDKTGIDLTHLPTAGSSESIAQLLGGHVEGTIVTAGEIIAHVKAGKARVLATFEAERVSILKDAPTFKEVLGYDVAPSSNFYMIVMPKGTPNDRSQPFHDALEKAIASESFQKFANEQGYVAAYLGLGDLKKMMVDQDKEFGAMVKKVEHLIKK